MLRQYLISTLGLGVEGGQVQQQVPEQYHGGPLSRHVPHHAPRVTYPHEPLPPLHLTDTGNTLDWVLAGRRLDTN